MVPISITYSQNFVAHLHVYTSHYIPHYILYTVWPHCHCTWVLKALAYPIDRYQKVDLESTLPLSLLLQRKLALLPSLNELWMSVTFSPKKLHHQLEYESNHLCISSHWCDLSNYHQNTLLVSIWWRIRQLKSASPFSGIIVLYPLPSSALSLD